MGGGGKGRVLAMTRGVREEAPAWRWEPWALVLARPLLSWVALNTSLTRIFFRPWAGGSAPASRLSGGRKGLECADRTEPPCPSLILRLCKILRTPLAAMRGPKV